MELRDRVIDTHTPAIDRTVPRFTALLLAVALLLGAAWVRGRVVSDTVRVLSPVRDWTFHGFCGRGSVAFAVTGGPKAFQFGLKRFEHVPTKPPIDFHARWAGLGEETRLNAGGFVVLRNPGAGTYVGVLVPCLPIAGGLAALAAARVVWFRLWTRRRRRMLAGQCPDCGEDMRALSERCGNCGRPRVRGGIRISRTRADQSAQSARRAA